LLTPSKRSQANKEKIVLKSTLFAHRHPYWAAALLLITTLVAFLVSGAVITVLKWPAWSLHLIAFLLLSVMATALLAAKGWWREAGFRAPNDRRFFLLAFLDAGEPLLVVSLGAMALDRGAIRQQILESLLCM
jgi:hypothetical protein